MGNQTKQVHQELRQRIIDGVYRPAESLTELSLAAEFGVSRNTVRKVLLKLESENLVLIEENKSARVRRLSVEEAIHYLEVRELLETLVIRHSMPYLGRREIREMRVALSQMRQSLADQELLEYSLRNWHFHDVLYRVCPNRPAVDIIMGIKNLMKRCNIRTVLIPGRGEESCNEHEVFLNALEKKDVPEAERLMLRHLSVVKSVLQKNYELLA